jgi:ribA/ribD-fused uncharacterized protein
VSVFSDFSLRQVDGRTICRFQFKAMNYEGLMKSIEAGECFEYLLFYGHHQKKPGRIDVSCFSQWYQSSFVVEGVRYETAEHYMMAQKAKLFEDHEAYEAIISSEDPREVKRLGREVRNFDLEVWNENCSEIVTEGNFHKFSQNPDLLAFLLGTRPKILVEASSSDCIWGIGLAKNQPAALDPAKWLGKNLLGFALVEARRRLLTQN